MECAKTLARIQREAIERKKDRETRENLRTRSEWLKLAQKAFNDYIRARDKDKPCISCGRVTKYRDAGHYRTVKAAPELRFHPDNCHAQCVHCNQHLSGNLIDYRIGLVERIGIERVEWLEGPHEAQHYSVDDIKGLIQIFRRMAIELKEGSHDCMREVSRPDK